MKNKKSNGVWGPNRATFTIEHPASYVTFNSITNNPAYGDERNFLRIKPCDSPNSAYSNNLIIEPGKDYIAYMYFHNNASPSLGDWVHGRVGLAKNVKMRVAIPDGLRQGQRTGVTGYIIADNAIPHEVYCNTYITSTVDVALRYIRESATIYSKGDVRGKKLPDSLFGDGALIGGDELDGRVPPDVKYSGYITFRFRADAPNFSITNRVRKKGQSEWQDKITADPGDEVEFLVAYRNIGSTRQNNVVVKVSLPIGLIYIEGSTRVQNTVSPEGRDEKDGLTTVGLNMGAYMPRGNFYVKFSARVDSSFEGNGLHRLINYATVITANGNRQDSATVIIDAP